MIRHQLSVNSLCGAFMPYKCNKCRLDGVPNMASGGSAIWPVTDTSSPDTLQLQSDDNREQPPEASACRARAERGRGRGSGRSCIPSRCARENCVRCACTAATELTEGRQRTLGREDPTAATSLLRFATYNSNAKQYGRNRRSTDLRYHAAR
ncbi:unnamed protein product [Euphydryas editha]|uniref:Uncharacterized protein n=1 Tax=Euphydryas editha TaxID=104508 RepID=A0AAU9TFA5_EUPED|nr:unnamed protein product [Euphydryas editha]